jgi:hypothetical protein
VNVYLVTWEDATSHPNWVNLEDAPSLPMKVITTAGWLVYQDKRRIIVAKNLTEDGEAVSDTLVIPAKSVLDLKLLYQWPPSNRGDTSGD